MYTTNTGIPQYARYQLRHHCSACPVEPQLAMGDSHLSALNLNWFFRSSIVLYPKKKIRTHI